MRSIIFLLQVGLFLLLTNTSLSAQWKSVNGPGGGEGWSIAQHGSDLYAVTNDGQGYLFHSTDRGASWTNVLRNDTLNGLTSAGSYLFSTFRNASGFLLRSSNNGVSWSKITISASVTYVGSVEFDPSTSELFAATETNLYRSNDNGSTWQQLPKFQLPNQPSEIIVVLKMIAGTLYAGTKSGLILSSSNDGNSWTSLGPVAASAVTELAASSDAMFAIAGNHVYQSTNNGTNWTDAQTSTGVNTYAIHVFAAAARPAFLLASHNAYSLGTLYRWDNGSSTWKPSNTGMPESVFGIVFDSPELLAITGTGVFASTDNGNTWKSSNNGLVAGTDAIAMNNGTLYVDRKGYLYSSSDQGTSWSGDRLNHYGDTLLFGSTTIAALAPFGTDFIGSDAFNGIFKLTQNGQQRTELTSASQFFSQGTASSLASIGTTIFASASELFDQNNQIHSGVFVSTNSANSFVERISGMTDTNIIALATNGSDLYAASEFGMFYHSTNQGISWTGQSLPSLTALTAITASGGTVIGTTGTQVEVSTDNGAHWMMHNEGLTAVTSFRQLANDGQYLYLTTERGVFRRPLSELLGVSEQTGETSRLECYPNPATQTSMIILHNGESGRVECRVYDALGRVRLIASNPSDIHSFELDMRAWPTGCYFVQVLNTQGVIATTRLIKE